MVPYDKIKAYKEASLGTADKSKQVIMLYDGVLSNLHQAKEAIENKDVQERYNKIEKSYLIISGLRDCLDFDSGKEIAEVMKNWYDETLMRILEINKSDSTEICDLCIDTIKQMRDAWVEAEEMSKSDEGKGVSSVNNTSNKPQENDSKGDIFVMEEERNKNKKVSVNAYTSEIPQSLNLSI